MCIRDRCLDLGMGGRMQGFLDSNPSRVGHTADGYPVLGTEAWLSGSENRDVAYLIGIGSTPARRKLSSYLESIAAVPATVISPYAVISPYSRVSTGSIICAGSIVN